jgi:pimeloyl-ACP methyl ester carboxylesterase
VRHWLGYSKIDIWGGSYGTVSAQVYLRRHGDTVRAALLAAVAPVDELIPLHHAWAGQRAVDEIFQKCHAVPACEAAYPHLREDLQTVFDRVRKGVDVEVADRAGRMVRVRPSLSGFADSLRHFLYYDNGASFPSTIHRAAQGDLAPILKIAIQAQISLIRQLSMGMNLSVTCAEDVPFIDDATLARETAGTFLGDLRVQEQRAACKIWPRGPVPRDVHELVHTDVPVVLLSGGRDSVTPPAFAERAAKYMTNSLQVVFPESSHGNWGLCGNRILADFYERGSVKGLDVSCAAQQAPTKFILTQ